MNKQRKLGIGALVLIALFIIFLPTKDNSTITIVNPSNKSSPASVFAHAFEKATGEDTKFYQASSCEDAGKTFNKTKNAVMIYNSSVEFAARNKGLNCTLKGQQAENVVFVGQTYMYICRLPNSTKQFGDEAVSLGMASMYAVPKHEKQFVDNGANVKLVPYGGSKDVLNALLAGDIDLGWIGSGLAKKQGNKIDCLHSTDPTDENFIGKSIAKKIPDFRISYVVYTNATSNKVIQKLRDVGKDEGFNKYMNSNLITGTWNVEQSDVDAVLSYVDLMENTWSDKK